MLKMFIESLKNLTEKPATIGYPHTPSPSPKDYRGTIYYQEDLCIFCDLCEDICPPGAILFEITDVVENKREYSYNPYLCIYCHACVDVCPKADEGCLVQAETRLAPLGRDSTLPKDVKLGYFINKVTEAKNLDRQWDAFEERAAQSREVLAEYKAEKKRKKKEEMAAKKKLEAETKAKAEAKVKVSTDTDANQESKPETKAEAQPETKTETNPKTEVLGQDIKPAEPTLLSEPKDGKKDDLTQIKGIAEKIEVILNEKGIYHFEQIALWTEENIKWADENISFAGRAKREKWIEQAKELIDK